jgi:hypothetical protein
VVEVSDSMTTKLDRGRVSDEDRAAAARFLERKGYADLLAVLGLVEVPRPAPVTRTYINCKQCKRRMWSAWNGVCQRRDCAEVGASR